MMMGTAGELPKAPPKPVQFLEDMTDAEVMNAVRSRMIATAQLLVY